MKLMLIAAVALTPLVAQDNESTRRLDTRQWCSWEIMAAPDKGIPQEMIEHAHSIVVVPDLKTGAFIFGGKYGKGYLFLPQQSWTGLVRARHSPHRRRKCWLSDRRLVDGRDHAGNVMNEHGADKLLSTKFTLGAEGSVAAGPVGRTATAQADAQMHADSLSWSRSQGLFADLALEGATLRQDLDDNASIYGKRLENREIVSEKRPVPAAAAKFVGLLNKYSPQEDKSATLVSRLLKNTGERSWAAGFSGSVAAR